MRDAAEGAGEAAVGVEDAGAAVDVGWGAVFFGDAGERDVFTFERAVAIRIVGRVFGGVGWNDPFCFWFLLDFQESRAPLAAALAEQVFELGA